MRPSTIFGRRLPDGGTIGVAAPAGPYFNRSEVLRGVEWWEARGYHVKLGEGIWDRDDYVAGDPKTWARDLMAMFADPEVDVIQVLHGGYGSSQTIPYLDFEVIAENPKALVGFSDITSLHIAIGGRTGLVGIHANGLHGMGSPETSAFSKERLLSVLRDGGAGEVPRDPAILTHLLHAGKLEGIAGLVVGEMANCDWREDRPEVPRTKSLEDVLEEKLEPLGVPVLYKLPLGHGKHLAAIPLGVTATLDADALTLTIDEPGLR